MNILILSVGTRCKLVHYFKNNTSGFDNVIATDCSQYAPAIYMADKYYIVPKMKEPNYFDSIMDICIKEKIDVVLPLQEDELLLMSKNIYKFKQKGIILVVSDYETICLCRDKYEMYNFLKEKGIPTVETVLAENARVIMHFGKEVIIKPRKGAGSVGYMRTHSLELISALVKENCDDLIVQPYMNGREYGVDVYIDIISGDIISIFCKEKIRMRAGETEKSVSVINDRIESIVEKIVSVVKFRGPIDIDIIEYEGRFYVLEINPRFGGGYPHAYECGIDFMKMISTNTKGKINNIEKSGYKEGVLALKYSEVEILYDKNIY